MSSTLSMALRGLDHGDKKILRTRFIAIMSKATPDYNENLHEIVDVLIETNFPCVHVIDHPIFILMRNTLVDIFQKPADEFHLLYRIGELFSRMADYVDDKNIHLFQQLFTDATIIQCLIRELSSVSLTSHDSLISGIGHLIDTYRKFQRFRPDIQDNVILSSLIMPIVNFVKSAEYKTSFLRLSAKQDEITSFQKLILVTCPKYIVSFWCKRQPDVARAAAEETLSRSSDILKYFLPTIDGWKESVIWCMFYMVWLCQYSSDDCLLVDYSVQHTKLLDYVLKIVQGKKLLYLESQDPTSGNLQKRASELLCYATLYIYATTFLPELCQKLKEYNITSILLRLTKANYSKTQFHAYRILAVVLSSDDIKQLANAAQITTVFIFYLKESINLTSTRSRLMNLLLNLKNLSQHDEIKAEFGRQVEGLSLLIQCATESQFDPEKVQLCALEIIMSLTFNNEVEAWLRQNNIFVQYLQTLTSTSNAPYLQKVAGGILWRLYGKTEHEFQYDVMISYCHKDKHICHRIHEALNADKFRVWIDREEMHGSMMEVMADAIKQSRCVLICMSDNYYLSPYCQAEAKYAFEKRRCLIPIRVQSGYKADGWLAFITTCLKYVDFTKMDFDTAYTQVVSEIRHSKAGWKNSSVILSPSKMSEAPAMREGGLESTVASLQKRVELIDSGIERIHDSLNWIMKAMARVKMANEDPPLIEHKQTTLPSKQ
ncbi:unnamed protein product [Rotaria socialis]|uniref:TIR domain-containing protein n=3 Tax=Rotaria socialis TaxID=392032 RepID=A0A817U0R4_9BILA|nr:unnamed protein product [Rotaria socialis]